MTDKRMRVDQETLDLAKEFAKVLQSENGGKYYNYQSVKIALKKALNK